MIRLDVNVISDGHQSLGWRRAALPGRTETGPQVAHLIGPGGAGKTSVGRLLAQRLGWQFIDLDQCFMSSEGDIPSFMAAHGYAGYARRNVSVYEKARRSLAMSTVFALSSGFMTYSSGVHEAYRGVRDAIEADALTALLLPTFELESCAEIIVQRQLARPYLRGDRRSELARISERFPLFVALRCARFRSDAALVEIASRLEAFTREQVDRGAEP